MKQIPEDLQKILEYNEILKSDIIFNEKVDLDDNGQFIERWIILTNKALIIQNQPGENGSTISYPLSEIDELRTERLISSGMLVIKCGGTEKVLCRYTNSCAPRINRLAKAANKLIKKQELKTEDLDSEKDQIYCPKCGRVYADKARKVCTKCMDKKAIFIRVLSFVPKYKFQIGMILLCMLASSALNLLNPYIGGNVFYDQVLTEGGRYHGKILEIVSLMVAAKLAALIISIMYGRINSAMAAKVVYDLKCQVFEAMQRLSLSFFNNKQTGSLMTRVNHDAAQLQTFFNDGLPYFIVNLVNIIGIAVTMIMVNWQLALLVLLPAPAIVVILKRIFPKLWRLFSKRFRQNSIMNAMLSDTLNGIRVVKAFGKEDEEINRFESVNEGVRNVNREAEYMSSTVFPSIQFIMGLGGLIIWGVGGWYVVNGKMSFGTLITFTGYIGMIYGPLEFMTHIVDWWSNSMNSAERIFNILDAVSDLPESPNPVRMPSIKGEIVMDKVTFEYEANRPVLHDVDIHIRAGEMLGLVGHSGAGKSTIINLIARLYDVTEGKITIDGVHIKDIKLSDLRSQIGMVLQDTYLFTGTIWENIAYAKPDAGMDEIIYAAKLANAHDFIMNLPEGYDTKIGQKGYSLSGGEKQRIAIARALLHNPAILILDEATSSVDTETERQVQEALERLVKGRTTIAIAHRLSTLRNADRLVVIERGRVVEVGTHSELEELGGVYYKLLQHQKESLRVRGVDD